MNPQSTIAVYAVVLVLHALLNTFGIRLVALLNDVSVWWHVVGVAVIVVVCVLLNQHTRTDLGHRVHEDGQQHRASTGARASAS